ncbi:hypothetical protein B0T26DRAFT_64077 [Lasiosphaeria miniovina]|uniref:Uncharacterized protein n=1 Tax=Lasiosphaeria miniovina TaxID=1954250 RepID=A0AA40EEA7_9PEZI|nr:uncharacterized protein B0T26DRAFT_64077 [Lasiosphaeria miniovina]KAK0734301.1 hypothetical protein B0T26DRAFT_64077 [Lasiosphaeria miniovina]
MNGPNRRRPLGEDGHVPAGCSNIIPCWTRYLLIATRPSLSFKRRTTLSKKLGLLLLFLHRVSPIMAGPVGVPGREHAAYVESVRSQNWVKMQEAVQKIRQIYDAGTPFFNKDAMRQIVLQIENVESGKPGKVSVTGLDGTIVQLTVRTGQVDTDIGDPDVEEVYTKAHLGYHTVDHLTTFDHPVRFHPKLAYLPLSITHVTECRSARTKSPIRQCPYLSPAQVSENFQQDRVAWETSKTCDELKSLLASAGLPP